MTAGCLDVRSQATWCSFPNAANRRGDVQGWEIGIVKTLELGQTKVIVCRVHFHRRAYLQSELHPDLVIWGSKM